MTALLSSSSSLIIRVVFAVVIAAAAAADDDNLKNYRENCVAMRFKRGSSCDGKIVVSNFTTQRFNFTQIADLHRFVQWIQVLSDVQRYAPQPQTIGAVAHHLEEFVRVDSGITRGLQLAGDAVYQAVAELYANYHGVLHFKDDWVRYRIFFNNYIIWAPSSRFKTLLATYAHLRRSLRYSRHFVAEIDDAAVCLITMTLNYPLTTMRPEHVKQEAYIYYVSKLSKNDQKRFNGDLYQSIEMEQFPHTTILKSGPLNITVHHNIQDLNVLNKMQEESDFVYGNFRGLWSRLNMSYTHTVFNMDMYVYKNRSEYIRTGLLKTTSVDNGGIALYLHRPQKIQASVFFDADAIPNAFGHELFHCLLFSTNHRVVHQPNSHWYLEGAANRFGFRKCFWRDYFNLRNYQHKTIDEIVRADYEDKILYPMGSALVSFLYEKRPELLKEAVLKYNYTIQSNPQLENEFTLFKRNKLAECNYINNKHHHRREDVQKVYMEILSNDTFSNCRNYIAVRFSDCVFVLTPTKLYLENNVFPHSIVNPQKIIRFNRNEVTRFDLDFLQKGLIKSGVRLLLDDRRDPMNVVDKFFSVDDKYSYAANVSCNDREAIVNMMLKLPILRTENTLLSTIDASSSSSKNMAKMIVQKYEKLSLGCQIFISPPVNVTGRLRFYVDRLMSLRDEHIAEINMKKPLDVRGNTIVHLAAIYNKRLFLRFYQRNNNLTRHLTNNLDETPIRLFENSQRYLRHFGHEPNRYCMTVVPTETLNVSIAYPPIIINNNKNNITDNNNSTKNHQQPITAGSAAARGNQTKIIDEEKNETKIDVKSVKVALISITVAVVVLTVVGISCNTIITITIVKHYNNKTNSLISSTIQYNKQKFYTNDESTLPLFS
ncbi:ORF30 [Spodoptera eridania nucleopolyhedrovirus]|uniref:ORF30 n=1 Tax=Spodoptera eridania nucleopolyhedrovirus TaxID=2315721 RepID=A0A346TPW8_9ABAC|nr:ORF30 [Spodoptera eridania nucleopolyhedrovirus]AXU41628.1 ORF30 [Spodoptera eridania nucleopolyhedrovirus]